MIKNGHFLIIMKSYNKYFAVSENDKSWGIYTLDCGTSQIQPGAKFPLPKHPESYRLTWERGRILHEFQMIYLVDGKGIFQSQTSGQINLEAGSIILIHPETWHRYKPDAGNLWHTYWVGFDGTLANHFIEKLELSKTNPVKSIGYQENIIFSIVMLSL